MHIDMQLPKLEYYIKSNDKLIIVHKYNLHNILI